MLTTRDILLSYIYHIFNAARLTTQMYEDNEWLQRLLDEAKQAVGGRPGREVIKLSECINEEKCNRIFMDNPIREVRLGSKHARGDYFAFMNTIFEDKKITWAQLTLAIIFTGRLVLRALEESELASTKHIINWCEFYFRYNSFEDWIIVSRGWDAMPSVQKSQKKMLLLEDLETIGMTTLLIFAIVQLGTVMVPF